VEAYATSQRDRLVARDGEAEARRAFHRARMALKGTTAAAQVQRLSVASQFVVVGHVVLPSPLLLLLLLLLPTQYFILFFALNLMRSP